jgi:hypothetical protein
MASIIVNSTLDIGLDDILAGLSRMETADIEQFHQKVSSLVAQRKVKALSHKETDLLRAINQAIPADIQLRFELLSEKLQQENITSEEHQELLSLINLLEQKHTERLKHLIALSQHRNMPLPALMEELKIAVAPFRHG